MLHRKIERFVALPSGVFSLKQWRFITALRRLKSPLRQSIRDNKGQLSPGCQNIATLSALS
jgi:hypothetical protein